MEAPADCGDWGRLYTLHFYQQLDPRLRRLLIGGLLLAVVIFSALLGIRMVQNVESPPLWDYSAFWIYGQIGAKGLNFYDPASYQAIAQESGLAADPEFKHEIVDVGFFYPTPSMWILLPLGFTDIHTSLVLWYGIQIVVVIAIITLIWRMYFPQAGPVSRWLTIGLAAMLLIGMQATRSNVGMGQSMFLLLLCFVLFWRERDHWRGGVWLALGFVVKPFMAVLVLYLLLRRRWSTLVGAALAGFVIVVFTVVGFGLEQTVAYLVNNPTPRMPPGLYTEWTNQSLLSGILRLIGYQPEYGSGLSHPLFLLAGGLLTLLTIGLVVRLKGLPDDMSLSLVAILSILIYPASQDMYSIILILPLLVLWGRRSTLRGGVWTVLGLIVVTYYLLVTQTVLASLGLWLVFFWIAIGQPLPTLPRLSRPRLARARA